MSWKFLNRSVLILVMVTLAILPLGVSASTGEQPTIEDVKQIIERLEISDDPEEAWNSISENERAMVFDLLVKPHSYEIDKHEVNSQEISTSSTCWNRQRTVTGRNFFGATLFTFNVTHFWCGNGNTIVSATFPRIIVSTPSMYWSYEGLANSSSRGGVGQTLYGTYRQGHFRGCFIGQCTTGYPWIDHLGYANGAYAGSQGGG